MLNVHRMRLLPAVRSIVLLAVGAATPLTAEEFEKGCPRQVFLGAEIIEANASCVVAFEDLATDWAGAVWVADGRRVLRFASFFDPGSQADVILGKPNFITLDRPDEARCSENTDSLCWFDRATRLALDPDGRVWVATDLGLMRFSPPFSPTGTAADFVLVSVSGTVNHVETDQMDNLWVGIDGCRILRYSAPIGADSEPDLVVGASNPAQCAQALPGPRQFFQSGGFTFDPAGNLLVTDNGSNRILIFQPPFETFMEATTAIGQNNLTAFEALPFEAGGIAFLTEPEADNQGRVWVIHNLFFASMYDPPWSTGMVRDYWFDFFNETPNGPRLPERLSSRYQRLALLPDGTLLLFGGTLQGSGERVARIEVPVIASGAIVNSATFRKGLSPGGIYTLFGTQLGFASGLLGQVQQGQLQTVVGKTMVTVNGERAGIFFASENQVNFQAPFDLAIDQPAKVEVWINGFRGPSETIEVTPTDPGVFLLGDGRAAVVSETGVIGTLQSGRFAVAFATGLGMVDGSLRPGTMSPTDRLYSAIDPVEVFLGSRSANTLFAGLTPGFVGLYQVNFQVPDAVVGSHELLICQSARCSPPVTVSIQ